MEVIRDSATVSNGPPEAVWRIIGDPDALRRVLPGCESLVAEEGGRFRGVVAARIQFLTVRADVTASFEEVDRPRHLLVQLDGRPRALAGSFSASIPIDVAPAADGGTSLAYAVELTVTGRLATFGLPLLRQTMRDQIVLTIENLEAELARPGAGTSG